MCWDAHRGNGINILLQAGEQQQERQEAELWARLCLGCGIINRDFPTYNPNDLAACEFEAKGSDSLEMMVAHGMGLPFLGCPLLLLHTADTS